ncbi:Retrovirus-related Pol polyprotein from transposon 17.6 [Cucumis melo var. makuwa]|uniref:Retrovirus-related Pol polyprotein from transposon 17.6 n=1 Tax=Cucumis melo var. makuwa TaxID=1194695 RepID=A0A5D3BKR0_CUCMM|nr:Retrovirus-related Pol polyprotein from transposon 17.6 [Cucumis melo var. makuwa]
MDEEKIEIITNWQTLKSIKEVQVFIGLTSYYRKFIKNFSYITTPTTDCLKKGLWVKYQQDNFEVIKLKLSSHPVLKLLIFDNPFEDAMDACGAEIEVVLSQGGHPVEFFSEKVEHPKGTDTRTRRTKTKKRKGRGRGRFLTLRNREGRLRLMILKK